METSDWNKMTVVQLKEELSARGLDVVGKKVDLVNRLMETESIQTKVESQPDLEDSSEVMDITASQTDIKPNTPLTEMNTNATEPGQMAKRSLGSNRHKNKKKKKLNSGQPMPITPLAQLHTLRKDLVFSIISQTGPVHASEFTISVLVDGQLFEGRGPSKQKARTAAAEAALECILDPSYNPCNPEESTELTLTATEACHNQLSAQQAIPPERTPHLILHQLCPSAFFSYSKTIENEGGTVCPYQVFNSSVVVADNQFVGIGRTKQLARAIAAQGALEAMFGLEFGFSADGHPYFVGDESLLKGLPQIHTKPAVDLNQRSLVAIFYDLYPEAKFTIHSSSPLSEHKVTVEVEESSHTGTGQNNKEAKLRAVEAAMADLEACGKLQPRRAFFEEKRCAKENARKQKKWKNVVKSKERLEFRQENEEESGVNAEESLLTKLLARLNPDQCPDKKFELLANRMAWENAFFVVRLEVNGHRFAGGGALVDIAKLEALEVALKSLALWNSEDSTAKEKCVTRLLEASKVLEGNVK